MHSVLSKHQFALYMTLNICMKCVYFSEYKIESYRESRKDKRVSVTMHAVFHHYEIFFLNTANQKMEHERNLYRIQMTVVAKKNVNYTAR